MSYKYLVKVAEATPANGGKPAMGPEYRNIIAKDGHPTMAGMETCYDLWTSSVKKYAKNNCLGRRETVNGKAGPFVWQTYEEANADIATIGSAMVAVGLGPGSRVGIYGGNAPEWMKAMQACNRQSMLCVPLYDTLGENAISYIIKHAGCSIVFVTAGKADTLAATLANLSEQVKTVVVWGTGNAGKIAAIKATGVTTYTFEEFAKLGAAQPAQPVPPKADDLSTIMYTSGTTGDPKGVMISHNAVVSTIVSGLKFIEHQVGVHLGEGDVFLSYLPLAHILDRVAEELFVTIGGCMGYWQGDIKLLIDDIGELKPHFFAGVPRVFERIYAGIKDKVAASGAVSKFIFGFGYDRKLHAIQRGVPLQRASRFFDAIVFNKIKGKLGGRVKLILSGGAPLSKEVEEFLQVAMCAPVVQGYGLTETCAASFIGIPSESAMAGTVGPPQPVVSFRLAAVPEMNYDPLANPPAGEVLIKGPSVFKGYYKMEEKTHEVLSPEGWFETGDIATLTPLGALKIIDRKKNIFKLSQGEYVAVEKVEEVYKGVPQIEQVWVYGNSFESSLVAVVVPKAADISAWAAANGKSGNVAALCAMPEAKKWMLDEMNKAAKAGNLKGFEVVKAIMLEPEPWTPESELLTPTFKFKRPQLQKRYQSEIDAMYAAMKKK